MLWSKLVSNFHYDLFELIFLVRSLPVMRRIFLSCDPPTAFDVRASQTLCDVLALISERGSPSLDAPEWSHLYRRILVHEIFCADQLRIRTIVLQVYKI